MSFRRNPRIVAGLGLLLAALAGSCATAHRPPPTATPAREEVGEASWYGPDFHGKITANGERYNMLGLTAAHRTLPFNTLLRVTNLANQRSIVVRVNDRGPFLKGRILDLSYAAARALGANRSGVIRVRIRVVDSASPRPPAPSRGRK
jgi:rare lipoprotein A